MMKILIAVILLVGALLPEQTEPFAFEGVTWDITPEAAQAWMGEGAALHRETWGAGMGATIVVMDDTRCLDLDCGRLMLFFYNERLCTISAYYTEENLNGDMQALVDAVAARYGEPEYPEPNEAMDLMDLFDMMSGSGTRTVCSWQPDADTRIEVTDVSSDVDENGEPYPYMAILGITNGPVWDEMNAAVDTIMEQQG